MTPRFKKLLGVGLFVVAVVVIAVLVMGRPGAEMADAVDDLCACRDDACRDAALERMSELSAKYDGERRSSTEVQQWNEALARARRCLEASPP